MKTHSIKIVTIVLFVAVVCTCVLAVMAGCSSPSKNQEYKLVQDGQLNVAMSLDFPPFESIDGDAEIGFDVALAQELANRLGLECKITNVDSKSVVPMVSRGGSYDVGISALSINDRNTEKVDFSSPYYISGQAIVVRAGDYENADELKDKLVAAQPGTSSYFYARDSVSQDVVPHSDLAECFTELQKGKVEAVVTEREVARNLIAQGLSGCEILEEVVTNEEYGIAVNKDNQALTEAINEALASMEADGTLESLREQYLK